MFLLNGCFQFLKNLQKLFNFLESKRQKKYIRIYYDNAKIIKNYLFWKYYYKLIIIFIVIKFLSMMEFEH